MTTDGEMPVEWLERGDRVMTRDRGAQQIVWITRSRGVGPDGFPLPPPVMLCRDTGAVHYGPGDPLRLSPNAHVLIVGAQVQLNFGVDEAMARIGDLSSRSPARTAADPLRGVFHHVVTSAHDLILVNGFWVETTCAATASLLSPARPVREASTVFGSSSVSPRRCLTAQEAALICASMPEDQSYLGLLAA